jgi:hypothetical protein
MDSEERFHRPIWTRYCNLQRLSTPMEARQGLVIRKATTCRGNPADTWNCAVDLRQAVGSRVAET